MEKKKLTQEAVSAAGLRAAVIAAAVLGFLAFCGPGPVWAGSLVGWGDQAYNSSDFPLSDVVAIAAGWGHNLALKADGSIVAWLRQNS